MTDLCPTPWKMRFTSRRMALDLSRRARSGTKGQLRPYRCECGNWHLSTISAADLRRNRKTLRAK